MPAPVNHRFPSGPVAIDPGSAPAVRLNSVTVPAGVTRTSLSARNRAYHRLPSGPTAIALFWEPLVGAATSVTAPIGVAATAVAGRSATAASARGNRRASMPSEIGARGATLIAPDEGARKRGPAQARLAR